MQKGNRFSYLAKTKRNKRRGREEDVSPSLPAPAFAVFPACIYLRRPHYLNAWNRGKKERHQNHDCLIQGSRAERHFKKYKSSNSIGALSWHPVQTVGFDFLSARLLSI